MAASVIAMLGMAMPALADEASNSSATGTMMKEKKQVDLACVAAAVDKRETAIAAGWDTYSAAVKAGLSTRRAALADAWKLIDRKARRDAVKKAWDAWRKSHRGALKAWQKAKKDVWSQFAKDRKGCGPGASSEAPENSSNDAQL